MPLFKFFNQQFIQFFHKCLTRHLCNKASENINAVDCCLFAKLIEAQKEADDNLLNVRQQMREIVMRTIQNYLDQIPACMLKAPGHRALAKLLITKTLLDPLIQFEKISQQLSFEKALEQFSIESLKEMTAWHQKYQHRIVSELAHLLSLETLKTKMGALIEQMKAKHRYFQRKVMVSVSQDCGSEVAVRIEQQTQTEQEQKVELEMQVETPDLSLACSNIPLLTLDLLDKSEPTLIHTLNDLIKLPNTFSPNLYVSENFAKTVTNRAPFQGYYKPLTVSLIVRDHQAPEKIKMVLISEGEAGRLQSELEARMKWRRYLYELLGYTITRPFEYCFSYPKIGYCYPKPLPGLEDLPAFRLLSLQYMILSGVASIPAEYLPLLEEWLLSIPNLTAFENFYLNAIAGEVKLLKGYESSFLKSSIKRVQAARGI